MELMSILIKIINTVPPKKFSEKGFWKLSPKFWDWKSPVAKKVLEIKSLWKKIL